MLLSISQDELFQYIRGQLNTFFPDKYDFIGNDVSIAYENSLERIEECIRVINHPGFHNEFGESTFSHLHADQYATLIYFLSNSLWKQSGNVVLCSKLLQLNRVLNSLFISYKCEMPNHFLLGHPIGTILGNAKYSDYLVVFQGVTVNTSQDEFGNLAPRLGKGLFLGANSKIIGNASIGDRVSIGVDAMVYQTEIPDDCIVIHENDNNCVIKHRKKQKCVAQNYFNVEI